MIYFLAQATATHPAPPPVMPHPVPTATGGGMVVVFLVLAAAYLFPSIRAWLGNHPKKWTVLTVNLLAGWTIIGYFVALRWSAPDKQAVAAAPTVLTAAGPRLIQEVQGMSVAPPPPVFIPVPTPVATPQPIPAAASQDDVEKLAKLGALYEKGLLSPEEFQKAKAKIIF